MGGGRRNAARESEFSVTLSLQPGVGRPLVVTVRQTLIRDHCADTLEFNKPPISSRGSFCLNLFVSVCCP